MFCTKCGAPATPGGNFCGSCGARLQPPSRPAPTAATTPTPPTAAPQRPLPPRPSGAPPIAASTVRTIADTGQPEYADVGRRIGAAVVDVFIWIAAFVPLSMAAIAVPHADSAGIVFLAGTPLIWWLYSAWYDSSSKMGTPGKLVVGIAVTDPHGERISFFRATWRYVVKLVTIVLWPLAFVSVGTAAFGQTRRTLHDMASGVLVLRRGVGPGQGIAAPTSAVTAPPAPHRAVDATFPMDRWAIWLMCFVLTPISGAILHQQWKREHPEAAGYANRASLIAFGIYFVVFVIHTVYSASVQIARTRP